MIEFSEEVLTHFNCDACKKWWSVGDWTKKEKMFCPHCGIVHYDFKEANPLQPAPADLKKDSIHLKLPRWLIAWLDGQPESRAVLIEDALNKVHVIDPPSDT